VAVKPPLDIMPPVKTLDLPEQTNREYAASRLEGEFVLEF